MAVVEVPVGVEIVARLGTAVTVVGVEVEICASFGGVVTVVVLSCGTVVMFSESDVIYVDFRGGDVFDVGGGIVVGNSDMVSSGSNVDVWGGDVVI